MKLNIFRYLIFMLVTFFSCSDQPNTSHENQTDIQTSATASEFIIDSLKIAGRTVDPYDGKFIPPVLGTSFVEEYKKQKRDFLSHCNITYDIKKDIYGFGFGIEKVRELLRRIDTHNGQPNIPQESVITGVRVYYTERYWYNSAGQKEHHPDVLIVPVMANGDNFYPIDRDFKVELDSIRNAGDELVKMVIVDEDDGMLLNTSNPCPNLCN